MTLLLKSLASSRTFINCPAIFGVVCSHPKFHIFCVLITLGVMSLCAFYLFSTYEDNSHMLLTPPTFLFENKEYAVIIDAGSSGSRVFIYTWAPHNGNANELLQIKPLRNADHEPIVMKIEPGLSSIAEHPWTASDYIFPLLQFVSDNIPSEKHKDTPLYILATAGLRLLAVDTQNCILDDLRNDIPKNFSFRFSTNSVEVISGKQEGVFQWIAINYVLGRFNHMSNGPIIAVDSSTDQLSAPVIFRKRTVGILDMGGASMQIAVELTSKMQIESLEKEFKNAVTEIDLGCEDHKDDHKYRVYVATYLSMGANEAYDKYLEWLVNQYVTYHANRTEMLISINDPCLPAGLVNNVTVVVSDMPPNETGIKVQLNGTGDFDNCSKNLQLLLKKLFGCPGRNCFKQQLPTNLEANEFYGFSEFWYSMEDVLRIGGNYQYYKFRKASKSYCATQWSVLESRFQNHEYPFSDMSRLKQQCFKSAWVSIILHNGLQFHSDFSGLKSSPNTIKGEVVHWSLGAIILKTRFLPLQEIQKEKPPIPNRARNSWAIHLNNSALVICFGVVSTAIVIYLKRLNCLKKIYRNERSSERLLNVDTDLMERWYSNNGKQSLL